MSYAYDMERPLAAVAAESERAAFIRRTYTHLAGAVLAFVGLEFLIFQLFSGQQMNTYMQTIYQTPITMLIFLAAFIGVGCLARWWAYNGTSQAKAYLGLGLYVVFEAIIFVPILHIAQHYYPDDYLLAKAGVLTLTMFGGLTTATLITKRDFSFLGPILMVGAFAMFGFCLAGMLFGFNLGLVFAFFGVALACGYILYDTSNVIHRFRTDQHVAASLELFASLAVLFYYVLRILLILASERK